MKFSALLISISLFFLPAIVHAQSQEFVSRQGTKFYLQGKEFRFVGFNLFDAANTSAYSCPKENGWWTNIYTEADLNQELSFVKQQSGATVLRFWAYQRYTNGGTDWSGIDKIIRIAKNNGFKIIPVLDDGPGYCTYPANSAKWKYNSDTWYTTGYKVKMGNYPLTYPEYVTAIVTRYKDEPTIFGWMMMNEADTSLKVNGKSALVGFAHDIGTRIKAIDQNHLLTVGTQSNGASGATGNDFLDVYGLSVIDFTEVHDWPYWGGDTDPLPESSDGITLPDPDSPDCTKTYQAKLACSIANSIQKLNKPIIMGEAGISAKTETERIRRADLMDKKMNAFFKNGGAGYLVWQMNKVVDSEGFDILMANNDPLLPKMKKYVVTNGDANGDGKTNGQDYVIWLTHYGTQTTQGIAVGDFNQDGVVNGQDYILWLGSYTG